MKPEAMWFLISQINWAARSKVKQGYNDGKEFILDNFDADACRQLRLFVSDRKKELTNAIDLYQSTHGHVGDYGGDDSFDDMISHVVGLGQEIFDMVMDNPKLLDRIRYTESFMYCLPHEEDLKPADTAEMADAKELIRALVATLQEDGQGQLEIVDHAKEFLGV